jgi:hypothetical protein
MKFNPDFSILAILEFVAICFIAIEIRSSRKNIYIKYNIKRANLIETLITQIVYLLGKIRIEIGPRNGIGDKKCEDAIIKLLGKLNRKKEDEKNLFDCLTKYEKEDIERIDDWIKEIEDNRDKVVTNIRNSKTL